MSKRPVSGTREWSSSSVNVMLGCKNDCRYCYARASASRFGRKDPQLWVQEEVVPSLRDKQYGRRKGTVMFPTTHDITPDNFIHTGAILERLLIAGNDVLIVTKPHLDTICQICIRFEEYKDQILFRFTICSADDDVLKLWEPGAPSFQERFEALLHAHEFGFKTSVSMEPRLETDEDKIVDLVECFSPYVTDAIWIGKLNKAEERLVSNGYGDDKTLMDAAAQITEAQNDSAILSLYDRLKDHPVVKWKESIKAVVGLSIPTEAGLDV